MPCNHAVSHLNALHKEYGDRGLVVVGVSDEGMGTLKKWAESRGVTYAIANVPKALAQYGVDGFPTAFSIDANGRIAMRGEMAPGQIEERLQQVLWLPDLGQSPLRNELRRLWQAGKFGELERKLKVAERDRKLEADDAAATARVRGLFDKMRAGVAKEIKSLRTGPDFLLAEERLKEIERAWSGIDVAAAAKDMVATIKKDPRAKIELDASRTLRDLLTRTAKDKKARNAALQQFVDRNIGTFAASQAQDLLRER